MTVRRAPSVDLAGDVRRHTEEATEGGEPGTAADQPREHTQDPAEG